MHLMPDAAGPAFSPEHSQTHRLNTAASQAPALSAVSINISTHHRPQDEVVRAGMLFEKPACFGQHII